MTKGERTNIRKAIRAAKAAGFLPRSVYDGEEHVRGKSPQMTEREVIAACESVDDSFIHFIKPAGTGISSGSPARKAWARVILGNAEDGSEVIADNSITPGFDEAMDSLLESF